MLLVFFIFNFFYIYIVPHASAIDRNAISHMYIADFWLAAIIHLLPWIRLLLKE